MLKEAIGRLQPLLTSMLEGALEQHRACCESPPAFPWLQALETYGNKSGGRVLHFSSAPIKHFVWAFFRVMVGEMLPLCQRLRKKEEKRKKIKTIQHLTNQNTHKKPQIWSNFDYLYLILTFTLNVRDNADKHVIVTPHGTHIKSRLNFAECRGRKKRVRKRTTGELQDDLGKERKS